MKRITVLCLMAILATSCSTTNSVPLKTKIEQQFPNRPQAYRDGYQDGCLYGRAGDAKAREAVGRDSKRIESDSAYANGWNDGYESCIFSMSNPSPTERRHNSAEPVRNQGGY